MRVERVVSTRRLEDCEQTDRYSDDFAAAIEVVENDAAMTVMGDTVPA
jgi:hypothetical protein